MNTEAITEITPPVQALGTRVTFPDEDQQQEFTSALVDACATGTQTSTLTGVPSQVEPSVEIESPLMDSDLERRFQTLLQQWRLETMKHSNPQNITGHDLYYEILTLGKPVLPLILRDLEQGGGFWFLALRVLAKPENPVKLEHLGNRKRMKEDWLEWGRQHGHLIG